MTEEPMNNLQAICEEFRKQCEKDEKCYRDEEQRTHEEITSYQNLHVAMVSPFEKQVEAYFARNEARRMFDLATQKIHNILLARFMVCANWSILAIIEILGKMEKSPASQSDKETIENLKKQLAELQKLASDMQPYVEMLKIGIEKKNKWLNDNR